MFQHYYYYYYYYYYYCYYYNYYYYVTRYAFNLIIIRSRDRADVTMQRGHFSRSRGYNRMYPRGLRAPCDPDVITLLLVHR